MGGSPVVVAQPEAQDPPERGIKLFRIAGIRIIIDYSWFIVFALVVWSLSAGYLPSRYPGESPQGYWVAGTAAALLFFLSILLHELAHSLVALRSGIHIPSITLFVFGGVSRLSEEAKDPRTEFRVAIVGPLSSLALALGFRLVATQLQATEPALTVAIFEYLAWINLALALFNLVPGFPLDGGRVLRAFWWWRTGSLERATRVASNWGRGFAITLIILGAVQIFAGALLGGLWLIFIGMFLRGAAEAGYQQLIIKQSFDDVRVSEVMVQDVVTVSPELTLDRLVSEYFLRTGYGGFPVLNDGTPVGLVSVSNVKNLLPDQLPKLTVKDVMRPLEEGCLIEPGATLTEALGKMAVGGLGRLLVVQTGSLRGMITKTGVIRLLEMRKLLSN
jgi:Zn-dependent protease